MATSTKPRIRHSVRELQDMYDNKNKAPLEKLMKAWAGIKALPADDPNSFFMLGGFHGEPFRGAGWANSDYWGGYCNHGNVLFPTWHRIYLLKIEEALQSIEGCEDVMLPYWDETSEETLKKGIPWALTDEFFPRKSKTPNPLRSFTFPEGITDNISGDTPNYSKPAGYETVRYPQSGLVGSEEDRIRTLEHNALYGDVKKNTELLNENVVAWINTVIEINPGIMRKTGIHQKYIDCLNAPNYTVFSNTTSASHYNSQTIIGKDGKSTAKNHVATPLESPHNSIHLAVGGFNAAGADLSVIPFANGDMGENDTAGLDPIFFFHHCNVDRMFWIWQKTHGKTDHFEIIEEYPGTNTVDHQGPTAGFAPNTWLTMESPLLPFKKGKGKKERHYTSNDCINIEKQLGLTYSKGSLSSVKEHRKNLVALTKTKPPHVLEISNVNRAAAKGSFMVTAEAIVNGKKQVIGHEAILSRWNVSGCANCQTHLEVKAHFSVPETLAPHLLQLAKSPMVAGQAATEEITEHVAAANVTTRPSGSFRQQNAKVTLL